MYARWLAILPLVLVLAVGLCGCSGGEDEDEVRVGVILPRSGKLKSLGEAALTGIRLRVDQINEAGGIEGKPIRLIVEDNQADKQASRKAFGKLATIDNVVAVLGPLTSTNSFAVKLDAQRYGLPIITPTATNDEVTRNTDYVFRVIFNDSFQGRIAATYAYENRGTRTAAVMTDKNSDYSKGLSASFVEVFESLGGQIVAREGYQQDDTDFGPQLTQIKLSGAELVFVPGYQPEVPLIIRQAKTVGYPGRLCGGDGWDSDEVIPKSGENIVGCFFVGAFHPDDPREVVQRFVPEIAPRLDGRRPGGFEALGYDAAALLIEALQRGGTNREGVKDALLAVRDFPAVTGELTITPTGDAEKAAVILEVARDEDGRYIKRYLDTTKPADSGG
jgi:branched-chain amino acid transport system substrate-binding protein